VEVGCQKKQAVSKQTPNCQSNFKVNVFPAGVGEDRSVNGIKVGYLNGRDKLEGVGVHGRTSKRIWRNRMEWRGLGSFGSRYGQLASSSNHNKEISTSIKLEN